MRGVDTPAVLVIMGNHITHTMHHLDIRKTSSFDRNKPPCLAYQRVIWCFRTRKQTVDLSATVSVCSCHLCFSLSSCLPASISQSPSLSLFFLPPISPCLSPSVSLLSLCLSLNLFLSPRNSETLTTTRSIQHFEEPQSQPLN